MRRVTVFGATGSIGRNTLDLIARAPQEYEVVALTGGRNVAQLAKDAKALRAKVAVTAEESLLPELRARLAGSGVEAAAGRSALLEAADRDADWVMSAIVGAAGLEPGLRALSRGATLALANKESMVCAGRLMLRTARQGGGRLLPVDSEHSAVFQALIGEDMAAVERVIITASGGAFRDWPLEKLASATPAQAATHPNWDMGQRITIDSASMFNKALELIETKEFFGLDPARIETVVHPESMIHALVGFNDGALMAHVGPPDMRHAIGFALHYPERRALPVERLDLVKLGSLSFRPACEDRWPALRLAREVMSAGGLSGAQFNAAKEVALDAFIDGRIRFTRMAEVVDEVLTRLSSNAGHIDDEFDLDMVVKADHLARVTAGEIIAGRT
ncbi:1-deoxy-D-xylulose-5-phosphate reductoisomerase [Sagittula salina]|uniref:1-deoxy-D-xylulose 5-phosphate reductoisomerase n=1 Tax=Sagittula salina TaxID=2820268 RepID=A0A940S3G5_9RHOB|nr:1-deoxy-D-xylulose-5-phosphate reductoisomerase [Sagittula salina]MBP0483019.1 1-deoxy-D-xylulose-5-phosphate reductoisomerase [Sagittula salina]